jgi:putative transcriptional regulator
MSKSRISDEMHQTSKGLYDAGLIDTVTMRDMDNICLPPIEKLSAIEIKRLRLKNKVSQAVFAKYLNVQPITVKKWELGEKNPGGSALRLLQLVKDKGLDLFHTNH